MNFSSAVAIAASLMLALPGAPSNPVSRAESVLVRIETDVGSFDVELAADRAPRTVANFLRYVDAGDYDGGSFYRTVTMQNQVRDDVLIEVIQAGLKTGGKELEPITLERTRDTGLRHVDGTISMGRGAPDSATSVFFICIGAQPSLDFGGTRNSDGQGFAAFGQVVSGMEVVHRIHRSAADQRENMQPPILILSIRRLH